MTNFQIICDGPEHREARLLATFAKTEDGHWHQVTEPTAVDFPLTDWETQTYPRTPLTLQTLYSVTDTHGRHKLPSCCGHDPQFRQATLDAALNELERSGIAQPVTVTGLDATCAYLQATHRHAGTP